MGHEGHEGQVFTDSDGPTTDDHSTNDDPQPTINDIDDIF